MQSAKSFSTGIGRWVEPLIVLLTAIVFDRLFWQHSLGLNLTLFLLLVGIILVLQQGWSRVPSPGRIALLGLVVASAMVYVHGSATAYFAAIVSVMATAAFIHQPKLRSLYYALMKAVSDLVMAPVRAWEKATEKRYGTAPRSNGWRWLRLAFLPVVVVVVFFLLYRGGNAQFHDFTAGFFDGLIDLFAGVFTFHTFFFLFALVVCAALLVRHSSWSILGWEQRNTDTLLRRKQRRPHWLPALPMDPLERERRKGIMLLALVNLLLLVVNVIDINWIWFGFTVQEGTSLKAFVHEGTWLLIISILLSIAIMLYLFRGNQNFYWRNRPLRSLAYLWIAQNLILGISVFLRNYHYIAYHGLAYRRIGVIVFLVLVLVGLVTLLVKIKEKKSFFYLARVNAWAAFLMMIALTLVDWDRVIVRYNLAHENPAEVDIDNYLGMSDRVLPLIYSDLEKVEKQMASHSRNRVRWVDHLDPEKFQEVLDMRRRNFIDRYAAKHWTERTLAGDRTYRALLDLEQLGAASAKGSGTMAMQPQAQ